MANDLLLSDFLDQRGYIPVRLNKNAVGHFEVEATVNGQEVVMMIDTGASQSVLDEKSAAELGLGQEQQASGDTACATGAGGPLSVSMAQVDKLSVDSVFMESLSMPVVNLDHCNTALESKGAKKVSGVIGADFLATKSAIIEYANGTLFLKS